jgi:hypothetical protein
MSELERELFPFVRLYRKLNKPEIAGIYFSGAIDCDEDLYNILKDLWDKIGGKNTSGKIELTIGNNSYTTQDSLPNRSTFISHNLHVEATIRKNSRSRFYQNEDDLIKTCAKDLDFEFPEFYYLVDSDYCHGSDNLQKRPNSLRAIDKIVIFCSELKSIANKVDSRKAPIIGTFYVVDSEHKEQVIPFDIELDILPAHKELFIPSFTILEDVIDKTFSKAHSHEKRKILKISIYEVLKNNPIGMNHIQYLIENWITVDKNYHRHLEIFISGISFSKLKAEIEERGLKFLDDINSSLIDISMKLTALPASFGLWIYIIRADHSIEKMWGFFIAILVMTLILFFALDGHVAKFDFVKNSVKKQLKSFKERLSRNLSDSDTNSDLAQQVVETEELLNIRISKIGNWLFTYKFILWLPALIVLLTTFKKQFCL